MKANDFKPFDVICDSMSNAAARLGVPIGAIKAAKREGSPSFRGSRINITRLRKELAAAAKEPSLSTLLLNVVKDVARVVSSRVPGADHTFRADSLKITQQIQIGLSLVACILEPNSADDFLKRSASVMEAIWTRKGCRASRLTGIVPNHSAFRKRKSDRRRDDLYAV
jgi:hypothetical protein